MEHQSKNFAAGNGELIDTISSIHGLLTLAHYYENREELLNYLALISTCILRVEQSIKSGTRDSASL